MAGRVLIVDGDPDMRDLFAEVLALDMHDVRAASSVDEALTVAWPHASGPQVILVDAAFAQGDDIPALGAALVRRWPEGEVVYLADACHPDTKRRLERGRMRHFARPFQIESLRDLVNGMLDRQAHAGR